MNPTPSHGSATPASDATPAVWPPRTRAERDRLREQAVEQAHALRAQALADFWRGTDLWFSGAVSHTRRSANRLAARLRQHAKQRGAAEASPAVEL